MNCHGLWMSLQFASDAQAQAIAHACIQNGLVTDWFLFAPDRIRIAPPLIITEEELNLLCDIVLNSIDDL
jgi:acetylornithine/succinyldiaminopimelate/putrescine aminotransferase